MKKLIIITLNLFLILNINAKDSLSYVNFKYELMNIEVNPVNRMDMDFENNSWKYPLILLTTFTINHLIVKHDEKCGNFEYTTRKTGIIYLTGVATCGLILTFETKNRKKYIKRKKIY